MNKTYLFIGADGATGSIITREFQKWSTKRIIAPNIQELDYRNTDQILFYLREFQPDVIFLVGAYTNVDKGEFEDKKLCWEINQDGIAHFLKIFAETENSAKIIYISTDMVGSGDAPLSEDEDVWSIVRAKNEYGKSKLAGEKILREMGKEKSFSYHIVRITVPFSGLRKGSFLTLLHNYFVGVAPARSMGGTCAAPTNSIRLVADQFITPTFAEDLAWNLHRIAEYGDKEVYHDAICDDRCWSVFDAGIEFAKICGWDETKIEKMSFEEMYDKKFWSAPRGKFNELIVKNLLILPSPTLPKISTMKEALEQFKEKYIYNF